jgi:hypothetical protein
MRRAIGVKKKMMMGFLATRKLAVLDILPVGSKFNQLSRIDYVFGFETGKPEYSSLNATADSRGSQK